MAEIAKNEQNAHIVTNPEDSSKSMTCQINNRHLVMGWFDEYGVVTVADGRQLEALNGKGKVVVVRIVHNEPVVDELLDALGDVALGHDGTGTSGVKACFNASSLQS
jgi:hypothetical protein